MSIIMRNGPKKNGDSRKQLYTWSGCGLVIILTLVAVLPNVGSEPQPDYSKFSSSRMQDLASLPFGTDSEAADFLRNNPDYKDVSNADLLGSLFSSEDRKARQAKDKAEGIPLPPDPEYKEIAKQKQKARDAQAVIKERAEKKVKARETFAKDKAAQQAKAAKKRETRKSKEQNPTKVATLGGGSGFRSSGGGGSSTVGSIWRYEGKDVKGTNGVVAGHEMTAQDLAFAKDKGRGVGLDVAAIESAKGANADDAEAAMSGAIDAFQDGKLAEDLAKDEEELGLDELPEGVDPDLQDDLGKAISDDVDKKNNDKDKDKNKNNNNNDPNANCIRRDGTVDGTCFLMKAANMAMEQLFSAIGKGLSGGFKRNGPTKEQLAWMEENGIHQVGNFWVRDTDDGPVCFLGCGGN